MVTLVDLDRYMPKLIKQQLVFERLAKMAPISRSGGCTHTPPTTADGEGQATPATLVELYGKIEST